jgi:hypothetical protein
MDALTLHVDTDSAEARLGGMSPDTSSPIAFAPRLIMRLMEPAMSILVLTPYQTPTDEAGIVPLIIGRASL